MIVKPDSGATGNYFRSKDAHILQNRVCASGPTVTLQNNETITACESGHLPVQGISKIATETHVYDELHSASLLSVGKLCNDHCEVTFRKTDMVATKNGATILHGNRNLTDGLWDVELNHPHIFQITNNN